MHQEQKREARRHQHTLAYAQGSPARKLFPVNGTLVHLISPPTSVFMGCHALHRSSAGLCRPRQTATAASSRTSLFSNQSLCLFPLSSSAYLRAQMEQLPASCRVRIATHASVPIYGIIFRYTEQNVPRGVFPGQHNLFLYAELRSVLWVRGTTVGKMGKYRRAVSAASEAGMATHTVRPWEAASGHPKGRVVGGRPCT